MGMFKEYHVLNLGAGVQSTTLALMYAKGELKPKIDAAIFADTGWEPKEVYAHLWWLAGELERAEIPLYICMQGNLRDDALNAQISGGESEQPKRVRNRWGSMPLFSLHPTTKKKGMVRRQCTREYKIEPIQKMTKYTIMGFKRYEHLKKKVRLFRIMGISADEAHRMRTSEDPWAINVYPLCDVPDGVGKVMTRKDCLNWLAENYPERTIVRSACLGCPYHTDLEWLAIKQNPEYWQDVVEFDEKIRNCSGMSSETFLHAKRIPLSQVEFNTNEDTQEDLFGQECQGMCGI